MQPQLALINSTHNIIPFKAKTGSWLRPTHRMIKSSKTWTQIPYIVATNRYGNHTKDERGNGEAVVTETTQKMRDGVGKQLLVCSHLVSVVT